MTLIGVLQRIMFYGSFALSIYWLVVKTGLSVAGEPLWPFLATVAAICGTAMSTNYISLKNYNDLDKGLDLGHWAGERLHAATAKRRQIAKARAIVGIIACLITGGMSAFCRYNPGPLSGIALTITLVALLLAIVLALFSILEAVSISQSEADILKGQRDHKRREKIRNQLSDNETPE